MQDTPQVSAADLLANMKAAHAKDPFPTARQRKDRLSRLEAALWAWEDRLVEAMSEDFGYRVPIESRFADIVVTVASARHARRKLGRWMKRRFVPTPFHLLPAQARVQPIPKGVVGIAAPWNFPVLLALSPLVDALAAGNRAIIKPSEVTPRTAATMAAMIAEAFSPDEVAVVLGGLDVSKAFVALPFDHLVFTGSTRTGKEVAKAAAENLTPLTLELGGKSPLILGQHGNVDRLVNQIIFGMLLNAGQTCVSPDYLLVPETELDLVADTMFARLQAAYRQPSSSESLTSVAYDAHFERLQSLVKDAEERGADVRKVNVPGDKPRRFQPTLVIAPPMDASVMQEEIFGPILPILPYRDRAHAEEIVAANPDPLALYVFTDSKVEADHWLNNVRSGAAAVNEVVIQLVTDTLPFGGVGASGYGAYHGRTGFETMSHMKGILFQSRWNAIRHLAPPYGKRAKAIDKSFRKFI